MQIKTQEQQYYGYYHCKIDNNGQWSEDRVVRKSPVFEYDLVRPPDEPERSPSFVWLAFDIRVRAKEENCEQIGQGNNDIM